jgi:outer membrane protein insertion porin family
MFDAAYYLPVAKNLVLATRTHFGFLGAYNNNIGIGPFERFRVGGAGLSGFNFLLGYDIIGLRGYQDTRVYNERTTASYSAGVAYNKYVTELRYAISTNPSATIFVLAFFEAGNNFLSYEKYNPFNVYRSVGVGARIFMPQFGLIGIDFGKALNDIPGLDGGGHQTFTFTIGQQLR